MSDRVKMKSRLFLTPYHLFFISTVIYFSPYFIGSFEYILPSGQRVQHYYSDSVGWIVYLVLFMLIGVAFGVKRAGLDISGRQAGKSESDVLLVLLLSLLVYVVVDGNIFALDKASMLEGTSRIHLAFYQTAAIGFVYCVITDYKRNRILFTVSALSLLLILYAGHRSTLMIAATSSAYAIFRSKPMTRRFFKLLAVAGVMLFILAVYKPIYIAIKAGNWDLVLLRLQPENLLATISFGMEQFVTFAHLDFIVSSDFRLTCSNSWLIPFTIVPYMDDMIPAIGWDVAACSYNEQVQPYFFSGYAGGVAANIWAEFYGLFGLVGLPVLVLVLSAIFNTIEFCIKRIQSPLLVSGFVIAMVNMSFYIQRKELLSGFISAKRVVMIAVIIFVVAWLLRKASRRSVLA